jgi:hypothetical protein
MLIGVFEEVWPWPVREGSRPSIIGCVRACDTHAAANAAAQVLAEKFAHSKFEGEFGYWWGHDDGAAELHRFVIRAASVT